jgi:hypothetical protein
LSSTKSQDVTQVAVQQTKTFPEEAVQQTKMFPEEAGQQIKMFPEEAFKKAFSGFCWDVVASRKQKTLHLGRMLLML